MDHKDSEVWKESMDLAEMIFSVKGMSGYFAYRFQKAAISIPSGIADAFSRNSSRERQRILETSAGQLAELETQYLLLVRFDDDYKNSDFENQIAKVKDLLSEAIRDARDDRKE